MKKRGKSSKKEKFTKKGKASKGKGIFKIFLNFIPIFLMIGLIPLVKLDLVLTSFFAVIIVISFLIRYEKNEYIYFLIGFILMFIFEYLFIATGVEVFEKATVLAIPFYLPVIWGYGFVVIKRGVLIIEGMLN